MKYSVYILLMLILIITACEEDELETQTVVPVVEAFLFSGEPVTNVQITRLISFSSESDELYINDATISLISGGVTYLLAPSEGDSGFYHYPGNDLTVQQGQQFVLEFTYQDQQVRAETEVPQAPTGVEISLDEIEIASIGGFQDIFDRGELVDLVITWNSDPDVYYYVLVENVEEDPEEINSTDLFNGRNFAFVTSPVQSGFQVIRSITLEQYGRHRVKVFTVNQEYADLFETFEQDSRTLSEPLSNVENGLGIFTAFNSDSVFFEVVKP